MKSNLLIILVMCFVFVFCAWAFPVLADNSNIEAFDEMTTGIEVATPDLIYGSDWLDVGAKVGLLNTLNPHNNYSPSTYALAVVTVKEIKLLNRIFGKKE